MDATTDLAALLDEKVNNVLSALKVRKVSDALWARHETMRCRPTVRLLGRPFAEEWGSAEGLPERIESMEHRRRLGLLVPSSDTVMEADLWRRLPSQFTLHVARMYMESTTAAGEERMLQEELVPAARRVASVHPELVIFGCTSAAALRGLDGDAAIARRVEAIANCPCVTVVQAAFQEIRRLKVRRLLLVTPYIAEINDRLQNTFQEAGLPVTGVVGMGLDDDLDIGAIPPEEVWRFVVIATQRADPAPECVFVSCTTFRAFEVVEDLERKLGIPVVTSNRSAFQVILRHLGDE